MGLARKEVGRAMGPRGRGQRLALMRKWGGEIGEDEDKMEI